MSLDKNILFPLSQLLLLTYDCFLEGINEKTKASEKHGVWRDWNRQSNQKMTQTRKTHTEQNTNRKTPQFRLIIHAKRNKRRKIDSLLRKYGSLPVRPHSNPFSLCEWLFLFRNQKSGCFQSGFAKFVVMNNSLSTYLSKYLAKSSTFWQFLTN